MGLFRDHRGDLHLAWVAVLFGIVAIGAIIAITLLVCCLSTSTGLYRVTVSRLGAADQVYHAREFTLFSDHHIGLTTVDGRRVSVFGQFTIEAESPAEVAP